MVTSALAPRVATRPRARRQFRSRKVASRLKLKGGWPKGPVTGTRSLEAYHIPGARPTPVTATRDPRGSSAAKAGGEERIALVGLRPHAHEGAVRERGRPRRQRVGGELPVGREERSQETPVLLGISRSD